MSAPPIGTEPDGAAPRPPVGVVLAVLAAAGGAAVAAGGALVALAAGVVWANGSFLLLALAASLGAFAVSSVRRHRWPWGAALGVLLVVAFAAAVVGAVALARRDPGPAAISAGIALGGTVAIVALLRRPMRAWHGYACPGCGAFRWPMANPASRGPCLRCGAPGPPADVGGTIPRWVGLALYAGWAASTLLSSGAREWLERRGRDALALSHADVQVVGWEGYWGAVASIEGLTGEPAVPLGPETCARAAVPAADGRAFVLDGDLAERVLAGSHLHFLERSVYLFRCERGGATARRKDVLAVMPTLDPRVVIRRIGTGAPSAGIGPDEVVARVEALAAEVPLEVTEVGIDYVAGRFDGVPEDTHALAARILEAAPAVRWLVDPETLARELARDGTFYLWWPDEPLPSSNVVR